MTIRRWLRLALALGVGSACAPAEPTGATQQAIAVPGPWDPPAGVRNAAAAQRVDVVDPPNVYPLGSCPDDNPFSICTHPACTRAHPGTTELDDYIRTRWSYVRPYGTYTCRRNSNNLDELSVHAIGRAIDAGIPLTAGSDADNTLGDAVANWLVANAEYIGIQRVGWDGMWWNGERGFLPMRGDPHENHLHIELSVDGAARLTRFFTEGPPAETCPIVCYGTAAVAEDCSYVDCAATGQVCKPDPVRCETEGPPEPSEAAHHPSAPMPTLEPLGDPSRLILITPTRAFDTRGESDRLIRSDGSAEPIGGSRTGAVTAWPQMPASSSGVWLNLAAVLAEAPGFVTVYPTGPKPDTSSLNYETSGARSNAALVPFGEDRSITFEALNEVHLVGDQLGYFAPDGLGLRNAGPIRVEDSRAIAGPIPADTEYPVGVRAPEGAVGVVATVTAIGAEAGFLQVRACGTADPGTSNVNYAAGTPTAATVVSAIDAEGQICIVSSGPAEAIVDVRGYLVSEGELSFQPIHPARLLDTRQAGALYEGRLGDGQIVELPIQSLAGAPEGIQAVVLNLTTVSFDDAGHLTLFPCGFEPPISSSSNFGGGRAVVSNVGFSTVGEGKVCVYTHGRTHLVADLVGVWVPTPGAAPPSVGLPPEDPNPPSDPTETGGDPDGGVGADGSAGGTDAIDDGCGCASTSPASGGPLLLALALVFTRRRR